MSEWPSCLSARMTLMSRPGRKGGAVQPERKVGQLAIEKGFVEKSECN